MNRTLSYLRQFREADHGHTARKIRSFIASVTPLTLDRTSATNQNTSAKLATEEREIRSSEIRALRTVELPTRDAIEEQRVKRSARYRVVQYGYQDRSSTRGSRLRRPIQMTGAENPPPSNFRRLVLGCIEAKFCK